MKFNIIYHRDPWFDYLISLLYDFTINNVFSISSTSRWNQINMLLQSEGLINNILHSRVPYSRDSTVGMRNHRNNIIRSGCIDQCSSPWVQYRDSCYIFATGYPEDWTEAGVCNVLWYLLYFTMTDALGRVISSWKVKCMLRGILHAIMTITNTSVDFGKNFH